MHHTKLFKAHQYFLRDPDAYDYDYDFYRKKLDWLNFGTLTTKVIKEQAFRFLNKWGCRFTATDLLASRVKNAYLYHSASISALSSETIQDIDLKSKKEIYVGDFAVKDLVFQIFTGFCNIGNRFRWVATSKLLHMINPNLFVMWDNGIAYGYGLKLNGRSYAYDFLPKMKEEVDEAILTYMRENASNRSSATSELQIQNSNRTLAKLIDEFNFEKHTRGRKDL
jgi:hypothetical protein